MRESGKSGRCVSTPIVHTIAEVWLLDYTYPAFPVPAAAIDSVGQHMRYLGRVPGRGMIQEVYRWSRG